MASHSAYWRFWRHRSLDGKLSATRRLILVPIQALQGTAAKSAAAELGRYAVFERVFGKC